MCNNRLIMLLLTYKMLLNYLLTIYSPAQDIEKGKRKVVDEAIAKAKVRRMMPVFFNSS